MPELPEVETLRRQLAVSLSGRKIKSARIFWVGTIRPLSVRVFCRKIKNQKIINIGRRAKILYFELAGGDFLLVHLKMTGQLIFRPAHQRSKKEIIGGHPQPGCADNLPNKFTRLRLDFFDGSVLFFNDLRKFGWIKLLSAKEAKKILTLHGLEPLEKGFTASKLTELFRRYPCRPIKQILMDQTLIAGIGNIYADESCFAAGILPTRLAGQITPTETKSLEQNIKKILRLSISKKGTSFSDYLDSDGTPGGFVPYLKVYGRAGEKCHRKNCRGIIKKIKMGGRGTHFCEDCQK